MPPNAVSIARPGRYGNPFKVGQKIEDNSVPAGYFIVDEATCLELFKNYVELQLMEDAHWLDPLKGKDLACFCKPGARCHGDVLLKFIGTPPASVETSEG